MAKLTRAEREEIAARRIVNVLRAQGVVNLRTLEQKISDAGPNPQRVQPHILTPVKSQLVRVGRLVQISRDNAQWLHLPEESQARVQARLAELQGIWDQINRRQVLLRTGQALELAVFHALIAAEGIDVLGGFYGLDAHGDERLYPKNELNNLNGRSLGKRALDFIILVEGAYCGVEVKNIRHWLYPNSSEIKEAIGKALTLGVIPVLIGRRIPFVTFRVLGTCGVIMHETFNQRMANADAALAAMASHKEMLGYHDIRVGNEPDARLNKFLGENLPGLVREARAKLDRYSDLLQAFVLGGMDYPEFAARVRRRELGQAEDNDWDDSPDDEDRDPFDD